MAKRTGSPTLMLRITPEDYERAALAKSGGCLIAEAIKRTYPQFTNVSVDTVTIRVTDRKAGKRWTYLTPNPAQECLLYYDQGWPKDEVQEIRIHRAVKVTEITRSLTSNMKREEKRAFLEAKVATGEKLSRSEKSSLTQLRKPPRPSSRKPMKVTGRHGASVVVHGGPSVPVGPSHPNLLRGHNRIFGAKSADPGKVFNDAVEAEVARRLAPQLTIEEVLGA